MKYMYEIRCAADDKRTDVKLTGMCFAHWIITEKEIPEAASKPCEFCNGNLWSVKVTNISEKDMFIKQLHGMASTFGYHVSKKSKLYKVPSCNRTIKT